MDTYFRSFQQDKGFTKIHDHFPIAYNSKLLAHEMETRLAKRQRIVRDLIRSDGVAAFPLKVQNIPGQVADAYLNNHPITISKTMSPTALWWLNVDQYNGPTADRSKDLDLVFTLLTTTLVGFEDRGNNNGSMLHNTFSLSSLIIYNLYRYHSRVPFRNARMAGGEMEVFPSFR